METKTSEQKIEEIHKVLIGDPIKNIPGVLHIHNRMCEDLYGIDSEGRDIQSKRNTVLNRLSNLEDSRTKVLWVFTGIVAAITFLKVGLSAFLDKFK